MPDSTLAPVLTGVAPPPQFEGRFCAVLPATIDARAESVPGVAPNAIPPTPRSVAALRATVTFSSVTAFVALP